MDNPKIYCMAFHNKVLSEVQKVGYVPVGLGPDKYSKEWLKDNTLENISHKNKYYGEYTFYYWFWKNILPNLEDNKWVGFCSYRELWGNKKKITIDSKFEDVVLQNLPKEWDNFDTIIGEHIYMNDLKFSKLVKHGLLFLARNPSAIVKSKRNLRFHFDMWHGNGNLDKAINLLREDDKEDFREFTKTNVSFNRGNMFVCRSKKIINDYFSSVFPWLKRCEDVFGFDLYGYGKTRIYGFLAERYLSFWFNKYTKPLLWTVVFYDIARRNK